MKRALLALAACASLAACGTYRTDRAISGGLMGAGAGAFGGPAGAAVGGVVGAGVGAFTPPSLINLGEPIWRRSNNNRSVAVDPGGRFDRPSIVLDASGYGRATYTNGCNVQFDNRGVRTATWGSCDNYQITTAEQEMGNYRARSGGTVSAGPIAAPAAVVDLNRMRANCEAAADRRWNLRSGDARATSVRGDDRTSYEIEVAAGNQRGRCTMALNGEVLRID